MFMYIIGDTFTSSNGGFPVAMLVYRSVPGISISLSTTVVFSLQLQWGPFLGLKDGLPGLTIQQSSRCLPGTVTSLTGWCLLICSSFSRKNGHPSLICWVLRTAQLYHTKFVSGKPHWHHGQVEWQAWNVSSPNSGRLEAHGQFRKS